MVEEIDAESARRVVLGGTVAWAAWASLTKLSTAVPAGRDLTLFPWNSS